MSDIDQEKVAEALGEAVAAIYFDDSSDFSASLWEIVRLLGGDEAVNLLDENANAAYRRYRKRNEHHPGDGIA